jgi:hypothetical protein
MPGWIAWKGLEGIAKVFPHDELHTDNSEAELSYV